MKTKTTSLTMTGKEPDNMQRVGEALKKFVHCSVLTNSTKFIYLQKKVAQQDLFEAYKRLKLKARVNDIVILERDSASRPMQIRFNDVSIKINK